MRGCGAFTGVGVLECRRPHRGRTPGKKRGGPFPFTALLASTAFSSVSGTKGVDPFGGDDRDGYGATESSAEADGSAGAFQESMGCSCCWSIIKGCRRTIVLLSWGCFEIMIHCVRLYRLLIRPGRETTGG